MVRDLVTAVMVTGKDPRRRPLALAAVQSFLLQTHEPRELLIVNDGVPLLKNDLEPRQNIREVMTGRCSLGELRNVGLEHARGEWVIQWDDDDWSHPQRIAAQLAVAAPDTAVTLAYQVRYSFLNDNAFVWRNNPIAGRRLGIMGTVLHPRTTLRYPAEPKREDTLFLQQWQTVRVVDNSSSAPLGPELYLRFCHDCGNTWSPQHIMRDSSGVHRPWALSDRAGQYLRAVLREHYATLHRDVYGPSGEAAPAS